MFDVKQLPQIFSEAKQQTKKTECSSSVHQVSFCVGCPVRAVRPVWSQTNIINTTELVCFTSTLTFHPVVYMQTLISWSRLWRYKQKSSTCTDTPGKMLRRPLEKCIFYCSSFILLCKKAEIHKFIHFSLGLQTYKSWFLSILVFIWQ